MVRNQLLDAFNGSVGGLTYELGGLELRTVSDFQDVKDYEHLIEVVDNNNDVLKRGENFADAKGLDGKMRVYVSHNMAQLIASGNDKRTIAHEFGHTAGWRHPDDNAVGAKQWLNGFNPLNQANLMWDKKAIRTFNGNPNLSKDITVTQLRVLYGNQEGGNLNLNTNFTTRNIWYYGNPILPIMKLGTVRTVLNYPKN